jgi:hypothetical protein
MKSSEATVVFSVCCNDIFYFALIWLSLCSFPFSRNVSVVGTHVGFVYWTELKLGATVGRKQAPPTVVTSRDFTYCKGIWVTQETAVTDGETASSGPRKGEP